MLITRLWTGGLLILIGVGILVLDSQLAPWFPILCGAGLSAMLMATDELLGLLPPPNARRWLVKLGVVVVFLANWPAHLLEASALGELGVACDWVGLASVGVFGLIFLVEAAYYVQPGEATLRIALAWFVVSYLGVLAAFLIQLRWLPDGRGELALALAIFVPKCGDIGAYFTGRFLGRQRLSPVLSPKKTWEGAVGGLVASVGIALGINALGTYTSLGRPLLCWPGAIGFGIVVGIVGQLGDLMESLLKRDSGKKDAAALIPSFGGMLDVLDSILFSAPVSYLWIILLSE